MEQKIISELYEQNLLLKEQKDFLNAKYNGKVFSLHWELRTLLYLGILLFTTGIGILVYKKLDDISHIVLITLIALITAGCFYYSFKNKLPYSNLEVKSVSPLHDYILLLGCLTFLCLEGYLQFKYVIFGEHYGLATIIPALLFFYIAYAFDHRGVLSMAIGLLAAWFGIAATPLNIVNSNDFSDELLIYKGLMLGMLLTLVPLWLQKKEIKSHFTFSYLFFGSNLLFIATLAGLFEISGFFILILIAWAALFFLYAKRTQSFFFLLISVIYTYIGITYFIFHNLGGDAFFGMLYYFILSCAGVIWFLIKYKTFLKK